jgi:hypothetical protein
MLWLADNFRLVFWLAVIPAFGAVILLIIGVREPEAPDKKSAGPPVTLGAWRRLPPRYWWVVALAAVMTLARFSEAFLILRAQSVHMTTAWIPPNLLAEVSLFLGIAISTAGDGHHPCRCCRVDCSLWSSPT